MTSQRQALAVLLLLEGTWNPSTYPLRWLPFRASHFNERVFKWLLHLDSRGKHAECGNSDMAIRK